VKAGTRLATTFDHYDVVRQIGSGGSGDVVAAQASDGKPVAIKALRANQAKNKFKRFRNELAFCSRMSTKTSFAYWTGAFTQEKRGIAHFM
jgi:serine/threonine protein kinase